MNTETQRARNARKRAKTRAKNATAKLVHVDPKINYTVVEFAIYGRNTPHYEDADEEGLMDVTLWIQQCYLEVGYLISCPLDHESISSLKLKAVESVAEQYGFNASDLKVTLVYFHTNVVREDFIQYDVL